MESNYSPATFSWNHWFCNLCSVLRATENTQLRQGGYEEIRETNISQTNLFALDIHRDKDNSHSTATWNHEIWRQKKSRLQGKMKFKVSNSSISCIFFFMLSSFSILNYEPFIFFLKKKNLRSWTVTSSNELAFCFKFP